MSNANRGFNPWATKARTERNLIKVEWATKWGSSIATSLAVGVSGYAFISGSIGDVMLLGVNLGTVAGIIVAILAAALAGWATDFAFSDFLKEAVFQLCLFFNFQWLTLPEGQKWVNYYVYMPLLWAAKATLVGLLLWFDIYSIKSSNRPVQAMAKQETEINVSAEQQQIAATMAKTGFQSEITALEKAISDKEANVRASNSALTALAASGNKWAPKELKSRISAATSSDRARLIKLQKKQEGITLQNSKIMYEGTSQLLKRNDKIALDNEAKRNAVGTIFNMFGIGMKVISVIIAVMLVLSFLIKHPNYDANGDGRVDYQDVNASFQQP
jgi:hypothetical protein